MEISHEMLHLSWDIFRYLFHADPTAFPLRRTDSRSRSADLLDRRNSIQLKWTTAAKERKCAKWKTPVSPLPIRLLIRPNKRTNRRTRGSDELTLIRIGQTTHSR